MPEIVDQQAVRDAAATGITVGSWLAGLARNSGQAGRAARAAEAETTAGCFRTRSG
jgi:hypothetical protein